MPTPLRATDPVQLGRYRLLKRLGEGGMGAVYLARDEHGRHVAVKVIRPEYAHDDHFRARFRSEVNRARQVPPFCTAELLDADPDHATPYLVVEYVDGPSLADLITEQGPLTGGNLHSVAVGVAAALAAIHGAGVIHRDLKPRNVLFALGTPKVIDFGIAQALEATSHHTRAEEMVGTLAYMAPERFDPVTDRNPTTAADVFSWGAVVTYAGTGHTPFSGDTPVVTAARILTQPPRLEGLSGPLAEVVALALAKDPADRPTANELLELLLAARTQDHRGDTIEVRPEVRQAAEAAQHSGRYSQPRAWASFTGAAATEVKPLPRPLRRKRPPTGAIAGIAAGVVALLALVLGGLMIFDSRETESATLVTPSAEPLAAPLVRGPSIFDPLTDEAEFQAIEDVAGLCEFDDALVATTERSGSVRCTSPDDAFPAQQTIAVRARLDTPGSCAAIWFRAVNADAYRATVCPGEVALGREGEGGGYTPLAAERHETATGTTHRLLVVADGASAIVLVDATEVLRVPTTEPGLTGGGRVMLGAVAEQGATAKVTLTDAALRSGSSPDDPPVPGFTSGSKTFTARLWMLTRGGGAAVIEPAEFVPGADYCERRQIDASSPQCLPATVADPSGIKVTMPVTDYKLLEFRADEPGCTDPKTRAGTCPSTDDRFSRWATMNSPFPAMVTTRGGKVVEVAQLDLS